MIVTIGNTKGGVGKTMLAVNVTVALSLRDLDVLLIDGDEQGTAMAFTELRSARRLADALQLKMPEGPGYTAVALHGAAIRTQVRQLRAKYDHIIIDVGGRDSGSLRAALTVSDCLVIPAAPRSFDLWGVDQTADLVREAREINADLLAIVVLNGADPRGRDNEDALEALGDLEGLEVAPGRLVRRKAYPNAAAMGLSVLEYREAGHAGFVNSAMLEFASLLDLVFGPVDIGSQLDKLPTPKGQYDDCTQSPEKAEFKN